VWDGLFRQRFYSGDGWVEVPNSSLLKKEKRYKRLQFIQVAGISASVKRVFVVRDRYATEFR